MICVLLKPQTECLLLCPAKKSPVENRVGDSYKDIAHPIKQEMRTLIEETVLKKYKETLESV